MPNADIEFSVDFDGLDSFMQELGGFVHGMNEEDAGQLKADLDDLMEIIKQDYVPIDTGELKDSGYVDEPEISGDGSGYDVIIGFTAEHALIQHERLDYNHPHGQAKYLEGPLAAFLDIFIKDKQQ